MFQSALGLVVLSVFEILFISPILGVYEKRFIRNLQNILNFFIMMMRELLPCERFVFM